MIRLIARKLYSAVIYTHRNTVLHNLTPTVKIIIAILLLISSLITSSLVKMMLILSYTLMLCYLGRRLIIAKDLLTVLSIPMVIVWFLTVLSGATMLEALVVVLRMYVIALALLIILTTTNAVHLSLILERLGLPQIITQSLALASRLIPITIRDSLDAATCAKLYGMSIWKSLLPIVVVSLERVSKISEALYTRGFAYAQRKYPLTLKISLADVVITVCSILLLVISIL